MNVRRERPYDLLVFDWDGTLMDSIAAIVGCARAALDDVGLPHPDETRLRGSIGLGLVESLDILAPGCDAETQHRVLDRYREQWLAHFKDDPQLLPISRPVLEALHAEGYLLAVATAKSRRGLARELDRSDVGPLLHATRTVDESPPKPDPRMLLDLMSELDATPERTLMIGDATWDLAMARAAGTDAVAVCSGACTREILAAESPLACLESVAELPAWLRYAARPRAVLAVTE